MRTRLPSTDFGSATAMCLILVGLLGIPQQTSATDGRLVNISTRALVETGDEVMLGSFIIEDGAQEVLVQTLGPELANPPTSLSNALADPVLTLIRLSDGMELMVNDDWEDSQEEVVRGIWGVHINLNDGSASSALVTTLDPGRYTAKVEGKDGTTGVALVEVYGIDSTGGAGNADGQLVNISTRALVGTGDEVMLGSFIIEDGAQEVLVQALGPELANPPTSLSNAMADPVLTLIRLSDGLELMRNDDWEDSQEEFVRGIWGDHINLNDGSTSSALVITLDPGRYTAKVEGKDGSTGVALVEVYGIEPDTQPGFTAGSGPGNLSYPVDTTIGALILPEASGGNGPLTYSLSPSVPGLSFDPTTRRLTGTPTTPGTYSMTYTVTDADGDSDSLTFRIYSPDLGSPDRAALTALYNATDGANWRRSENWATDVPLDQWFGVITDDNNRVTAIDLSYNELSGPIPAELGNLTNLENLNLRSNSLRGTIPPQLGNLLDLVELNLRNNNLSGLIPAQLANIANLETIYFGGNQFSGCIPDGLQDVPESDLSTLGLQNCGIIDRAALVALYNATDGPNWTNSDNWGSDVPLDQWYGVTVDGNGRVIGLELTSNKLSGPIPAQLGNLFYLEKLWLHLNQLSGPIPAQLGNLDNLISLILWNNQLTGPIPSELGNLGNLESLDLTGNQLSGSMPAELGNLANLQYLSLSANQLGGPIPAWLGDLSNLEYLYLGDNQFAGCIPDGLRDVANNDLSTLGLQYCGTIDRAALVALYNATDGPNWTNSDYWLSDEPLDQWYGVTVDGNGRVIGLHLNANQLSGSIPAELGKLELLQSLALNDNQLTGVIPDELLEMSNLETLLFEDNNGLCALDTNAFTSWLQGIAEWRGPRCDLNQPPLTVGTIPSQTLLAGASATTIRLGTAFADPDSDALTYSAVTADENVIRIGMSGATLSLTPVAEGATTVTVTATDSGGLEASLTFPVTVEGLASRRHNIILRVVRVTTDWMPYAALGGWPAAALPKESVALKYFEAAIWEETASVHLYEFDNNYNHLYDAGSDSARIAYREQYVVRKHTGMPSDLINREDFLKSAFVDFASYLVERFPDSDHHLLFSGHGGPGGRLFEGLLGQEKAAEFLGTWRKLLGRRLGVIDMGGPCSKSGFSDLENFCDHTRYYIASDIPNGGYIFDNWTVEKYYEVDPERQYHSLFRTHGALEEALVARIELKRKDYEYSRRDMIANKVEQANYLYSCTNMKSELGWNVRLFFEQSGGVYDYRLDLWKYLTENDAPEPLLEMFDQTIIHDANNRDFFEWEVVANGIRMCCRW